MTFIPLVLALKSIITGLQFTCIRASLVTTKGITAQPVMLHPCFPHRLC